MMRIGLVGARGYAGAELVKLLGAHPSMQLALVASRERTGEPVELDGAPAGLRYSPSTPEAIAAANLDAVVLALPNGASQPFVDAIDASAPATVIVDLSADHRFDPAWYYGLPELTRGSYAGQRRIANPGCYATAMQLAIAPLVDALGNAPVQCFGVSGYSGAGTTPSDKNDPDKLRDNLIPYSLTGHVHEREASAQLGHEVQFMPHVAPHFRGLTVTANMTLAQGWSAQPLREVYHQAYDDERLVELVDEAPWVSRIAGRHGVQIGGITPSGDGRRVVVVAVLDNLLKGAATQALQNLNLALGADELAGIPWRGVGAASSEAA
jgi:N-acetyl-gamma-glutamyl-phosphate reductase